MGCIINYSERRGRISVLKKVAYTSLVALAVVGTGGAAAAVGAIGAAGIGATLVGSTAVATTGFVTAKKVDELEEEARKENKCK